MTDTFYKLESFVLTLIFLSVFLAANCATAQTVTDKTDLSTDEGVIAALQKISDAKNAESTGDEKLDAKRKAADKLESKDVCIKRLKETTKIIVIGFFRFDYGCHFEGAFINSDFFEAANGDLHKNALHSLGWEKANKTERERIAKLWVEKVLFAFSAKTNQTFQAVSIGDDEIKVIVSLQFPPGITSRNAPKVFVFDKDGKMSPQGNY